MAFRGHSPPASRTVVPCAARNISFDSGRSLYNVGPSACSCEMRWGKYIPILHILYILATMVKDMHMDAALARCLCQVITGSWGAETRRRPSVGVHGVNLGTGPGSASVGRFQRPMAAPTPPFGDRLSSMFRRLPR